MTYLTVFVVSEDPALRDSIAELVLAMGVQVETYASAEHWLETNPADRKGCLVLDSAVRNNAAAAKTTDFDEILSLCPDVLLLVDRGDVPVAVQALRQGVFDIVEKPFARAGLLDRIKLALNVVKNRQFGA